MKQLIEFELTDNSSVFIEAEDTETQAKPRIGRVGDHKTEVATHCFKNAIPQIRPAWVALLLTFPERQTLNEIALESGIKFHTNAGASWASAGREAPFQMLLKGVKKRRT